MAEGLFCHDAGIVDEELCREVVSAVNDKIVVLDEVQNVGGIHEHPVGVHGYVRVHLFDGLLGGLHFGLVHVLGGVDDLPLQVGQIHHIRIGNADGAHARSRQIHGCRSTQTACADDEDFCVQQLFLALDANFFQDDVAGVALQLFVGKCHFTVPLP